MLDFLGSPANLPFSVALLVMVMIGIVEALGLGIGAVDLDSPADGDFDAVDVLAWLGVGKVPLLMLLVVVLAWFGMIGIGLQQMAQAFTGDLLSPWLAAPVALVAALPLTAVSAGGLARIMPGDETTAVPIQSLLGKRGVVTVGTARRGSPAQVRVRDVHGQTHYVMVEPHQDDDEICEGETVLLARLEGNVFIGITKADGLTPNASTEF